jgi:transposase
VSYKLTEHFSIKEAGKWVNQEAILDILNLERFHERVLYRTLEILGRNKEKILSDILSSLFFNPETVELIDPKKGISGIKITRLSNIRYFIILNHYRRNS